MHLIFFDEVKSQPDYPHYHIGGICIDEKSAHLIEAQINEIAAETFGHSRLSQETEFHATDIYHRKKAFKDMPDPIQRINILHRFLKILSDRDNVGLIDIQINLSELPSGHSADDIAFMYFCERTNNLVKRHKSLGILIGDRDSEKAAERCSVSLSDYRARGTSFAYGHEIKNLFESVHFTPSHLSRFLQLADIYAWTLQFCQRHRDSTDERHQAMFSIFKGDEINLFPSTYKEWPKLRA